MMLRTQSRGIGRFSLYTWTKGIAAGVYLLASLLVLFGVVGEGDFLWQWLTPVTSGVFLAITGGLLIWDLEHPERFFLIFTRPQWRSWLVKGAFVIAGYTVVLALHFLASWWDSTAAQRWLMIPGIPLATLTAVYTAYLFAQAKARDMWQNPLLPPHLLVQAILLGSGILLLGVVLLKGTMQSDVLGYLAAVRIEITHLFFDLSHFKSAVLMIWGEVS